jgi:acyl-CoA synthetase (AMP-forming)/AMP-acid ligase II
MITNDNVYWKNISHVIELGIREDVRALAAGPLYHVGALDLTTTTVLYVGGTNFLLDRFTPHGALAAISAHAITCVWLAPAMVSQIVNSPELADHELESVRLIIDGGEKMPLPLIDSVLRTFPNAWFVDAYGMTETVSGDTFLDKGRTRTKLGSVGRPVIHTEVAILDELDNAVPAGHPGEVVLRGPKVCKGYWRDPKATAEAIRNGWLRTGDMGYLDEDGYLFLVDRKKDMILSGGENISSAEVERALYEHPAVLEAAVVGVRDPRWGEVPVAYVVRRASAEVDSVALIAFCAKRLAKFKVPRWIRFLDVLPRNPSGKVLKRVLREQDQDAQDLTPCSADEG